MKKPVEPHVAEVIYDENGRVLGRICDNFVVKTQKEVDDILKQLGRLWSESCNRRAAEEALEFKKEGA